MFSLSSRSSRHSLIPLSPCLHFPDSFVQPFLRFCFESICSSFNLFLVFLCPFRLRLIILPFLSFMISTSSIFIPSRLCLIFHLRLMFLSHFFPTSFLFTSLMSDLPFVSFPSFRFHPTFPFPLFASPSNSEASTFPHQLPSRQQVEMSYEWSSLGGLMRQKVWERATLRNTEGTIHRAASSAIIIHP